MSTSERDQAQPPPPPPGRSSWLTVAERAEARGEHEAAERYRQLAMQRPEGT